MKIQFVPSRLVAGFALNHYAEQSGWPSWRMKADDVFVSALGPPLVLRAIPAAAAAAAVPETCVIPVLSPSSR
jgi:hypothetical protein